MYLHISQMKYGQDMAMYVLIWKREDKKAVLLSCEVLAWGYGIKNVTKNINQNLADGE